MRWNRRKSVDKRRYLGKRTLKKLLEEQGSAILMKPEELSSRMAAEDPENRIYGMQLAMFLNATRLSGILQSRERFDALGRAGYEDILVRGMRETGLTYETVEALGEDLISALGYDENRWKLPEIPDAEILPFLKEEDGILKQAEGSARGREAYECAVKWLQSDSSLKVTYTNVTLVPTQNEAAVLARRYLKRAAKDGCRDACRLLGLCCYYGVGGEKDDEEALSWLLQTDGYAKGNYSFEAKKAIIELLILQKKEKRKRMETAGFLAAVLVLIILAGVLLRPTLLPLFVIAGIACAASGAYFLFVQKSSEKKRNILAYTALAVWCLFVLRICW